MENIQINLENVSKVYDRRTIIAPFDLTIQKGSSIAIVGHNGLWQKYIDKNDGIPKKN